MHSWYEDSSFLSVSDWMNTGDISLKTRIHSSLLMNEIAIIGITTTGKEGIKVTCNEEFNVMEQQDEAISSEVLPFQR